MGYFLISWNSSFRVMSAMSVRWDSGMSFVRHWNAVLCMLLLFFWYWAENDMTIDIHFSSPLGDCMLGSNEGCSSAQDLHVKVMWGLRTLQSSHSFKRSEGMQSYLMHNKHCFCGHISSATCPVGIRICFKCVAII